MKIKNLISSIKNKLSSSKNKKFWILGTILVVLICLSVFVFPSSNKSKDDENLAKQQTSISVEKYEYEIEQKLKQMLLSISEISEADVMVVCDATEVVEYLKNKTETTSGSGDTASKTTTEEVVYEKNGSNLRGEPAFSHSSAQELYRGGYSRPGLIRHRIRAVPEMAPHQFLLREQTPLRTQLCRAGLRMPSANEQRLQHATLHIVKKTLRSILQFPCTQGSVKGRPHTAAISSHIPRAQPMSSRQNIQRVRHGGRLTSRYSGTESIRFTPGSIIKSSLLLRRQVTRGSRALKHTRHRRFCRTCFFLSHRFLVFCIERAAGQVHGQSILRTQQIIPLHQLRLGSSSALRCRQYFSLQSGKINANIRVALSTLYLSLYRLRRTEVKVMLGHDTHIIRLLHALIPA